MRKNYNTNVNISADEVKSYSKYYSDSKFWSKIKNAAKAAGEDVVYKALVLYYELKDPTVSRFEKAIIYGALGYLILPLDLIPDAIPFLGYLDDLKVLNIALDYVESHVTEYVECHAQAKFEEWFG